MTVKASRKIWATIALFFFLSIYVTHILALSFDPDNLSASQKFEGEARWRYCSYPHWAPIFRILQCQGKQGDWCYSGSNKQHLMIVFLRTPLPSAVSERCQWNRSSLARRLLLGDAECWYNIAAAGLQNAWDLVSALWDGQKSYAYILIVLM